CILLATTAGLGAVGNVITMKTFIHLGISDGVNLSLISLAASDLFFLISAFINGISLMLHCVEELSGFNLWFPVDPEVVYMIFTVTGSGFYACSMLVTTFITVVRCLAVALPLKFRNLLSWQATAVVISLFTVLMLSTTVVLLVYTGVSHQFDPNINTTRPAPWLPPERTMIKNVIFGARDVFLPLASQMIVGICVVIMARYLQKARIFRLKVSKLACLNDNAPKNNNVIRDSQINLKTVTKETGSSKAVCKELQAVQQMLLIATVYSLCNMPKVIFNLTELIVPGFYRDLSYNDVYLTCNITRELIQSVNASVTIFIYWKYNSKFRSHFVLHH
ncbi:unnamed protein product, partial [Lymnaea stagnalis]